MWCVSSGNAALPFILDIDMAEEEEEEDDDDDDTGRDSVDF